MAEETRPDKSDDPDAMPGRIVDIMVAVVALLFLGIFMLALTRWLFPAGTTLGGDAAEVRGEARSAERRVVSYSNPDADTAVAEVVTIRRDVRLKGHDELAWASAVEGARLADHDSLQTLHRSSATVRLDDETLVRIGANSLIVFQGRIHDLLTRVRTHSLVMFEGTLGSAFVSSQGDPVSLEVALPNGLARFIPGDDATAAAFNINVNPDLSASVSVLSGTGIVTIDGKSVTVDADHGITISSQGEILERGRLPGRPTGIRPRNRSVYDYRDLPPRVAFSWNAVDRTGQYRFRLARDADMSDVVLDERLAAPRFDYGGLQSGDYYWQVSAMSGFIEGPPSDPHVLTLIRDVSPPALSLQPAEVVGAAGTALVRGRTDSDARIYIQGEPVVTDGGRFEKPVPIGPGSNLIVVEAVDGAGNVSYDSQIVNPNTVIGGVRK